MAKKKATKKKATKKLTEKQLATKKVRRKTVRKGIGPSMAKQERGGAIVTPGKPGTKSSMVGRIQLGGVVNPTRSGIKKWVPPKGMSKAMIKKVKAGKICGAKLKGTPGTKAHFCQNPPYEHGKHRNIPYRCESHGGSSPGAPLGNTHALKHGLYVQALLEGESMEEVYVGTVDEEIKFTKIRLARALRAEAKNIQARLDDDQEALAAQMETIEEFSDLSLNENGVAVGRQTFKRRTPDLSYAIHSLINQLCKLENQRLQSIIAGNSSGGDGNHTPEEKAQMAVRFLQQAKMLDAGSTYKDHEPGGE